MKKRSTPEGSPVAGDEDDRIFFRAETERLMDWLYARAYRLAGNQADAEDLVAETLTKAWKSFGQLADRQAFPKWLARILVNTFISDRRRNREKPILEEVDSEQPFSLFDQLHQPFLLWWSNPELEVVNRLLREDIDKALDCLPPDFRAVFVLVEVDGHSYAEAAALLEIPIGTVRSRLSRARSMLQRALWKHAEELGLLPGNIRERRKHGQR